MDDGYLIDDRYNVDYHADIRTHVSKLYLSSVLFYFSDRVRPP